jgi:hypothetical protein
MTDPRVRSERGDAGSEDRVPEDVAAILLRASELGFSATRVAVALGVSARALASVESVAGRQQTPAPADNIAPERQSDP